MTIFKFSIIILIFVNYSGSTFAISIAETNSSLSNDTNSKLASTWVLKIDGDLEFARNLAKNFSFRVVRQVGSLEGFFMVESNHKNSPKRSKFRSLRDFVKLTEIKLRAYPKVELFEREKLLNRKKRDLISEPKEIREEKIKFERRTKFELLSDVTKNNLSDPEWPEMWYLNRNLLNKSLPDLNVTSAWKLGYSGKGVSVTFLDDGLEWNHPDIMLNYDPKASTDLNDNDDDPMPRYDETDENK